MYSEPDRQLLLRHTPDRRHELTEKERPDDRRHDLTRLVVNDEFSILERLKSVIAFCHVFTCDLAIQLDPQSSS